MSSPIPLFDPAPPWEPPRSAFLVLYHGCTTRDQASIEEAGIDLSKCRVDADFGRGFYTTTILYQARQWAWTRYEALAGGRRRKNRPAVLRFRVPRHELARLKWIAFVLAAPGRDDFWSLVQHCRQSTPSSINDHRGPMRLPDGTRWYDMACGPVASSWKQKFAMQDADQISFHTRRRSCCLIACLRAVIQKCIEASRSSRK
jgi:hypothetical protein